MSVLPEWLALLVKFIEHNIPNHKEWKERLDKAIPEGVDFEPVRYKFQTYLLEENLERVKGLDIDIRLQEQVISAIQEVLDLHLKAIKTGKRGGEAKWKAAWSAAYLAAKTAIWSANLTIGSANSAAYLATWSAAKTAVMSANPNADLLIWSAANTADWQRYGEKLIHTEVWG